MVKATKSLGVTKFKPKVKKKGSAFKQSGPKSTPVSKYRKQGR
jgi:hypothetical protein